MLKKHILKLLHETALFASLPKEKLNELCALFKPFSIKSGDTLMNAGDAVDGLYLVASGRLRAVRKEQNREQILSEMGRGELIGELGLLTQKKRSATVYAIRDSVLLKLANADFEAFANAHPAELMSIVRSAIIRLTEPTRPKHEEISTIAIFPAGYNDLYADFAREIADELANFGLTQCIDEKMALDFLDAYNDHQKVADNVNEEIIATWLSELEDRFQYVVYVADADNSSWTQRCVREADCVLWVGDAKKDPGLNASGKSFMAAPERMRKKSYLVLLYDEAVIHPIGTERWLALRPDIKSHLNLRQHNIADLQRLVRIITGRSIGLVLAGGGARGLVHIGVYRALLQMGIPIDFIGGTSSGAMMGALMAMEQSPELITEKIQFLAKNLRRMFDITVPMLSLFSGYEVAKNLKIIYGEEQLIENMWKSFFCTTSNLSQFKLDILTSGSLWKAIRASISLPALYPPITNKASELLLDGGIMNNLPVDVMHEKFSCGKIIAVRMLVTRELRENFPEGSVSGFNLMLEYFKRRRDFKKPNIFEVIVKSTELSSEKHSEQMTKETDVCIDVSLEEIRMFDVNAINLADLGYQATLTHEQELLQLLK